MQKFKKIMATLLAVVIMATISTSVMARDVSEEKTATSPISFNDGVVYKATKTVYDDRSANDSVVVKTATKTVYDSTSDSKVVQPETQTRYIPCIYGDHDYQSGTDYVCHAQSNNTCKFTSQRFNRCVKCGYNLSLGAEVTLGYHATGSSGCLF